MAAGTAASIGSQSVGMPGSYGNQMFGGLQQEMMDRSRRTMQSKWGKMDDAELRTRYDKGGRWKNDIFAEIQKRQTLSGFGQEAAGGNNVVGGDGDNRLMDIESRLAALEGGGENVMEGAGVGGSAAISGGFSDGSLDAAENIYGTEEERMTAAGASAQQTAANAAAISGL